MEKLVFNEHTPKEQYDKLFTLSVGDVFKVESDYETVLRRINEYKQEGDFEVFPITPGTRLYTMYGCDHLVVTRNGLI